jgi:uncharacterized protein YbcV (DUF1398 family)
MLTRQQTATKENEMDANVKAVILECAKASAEGRIMFGDVVKKLMAAGVERYYVDFMRGEASYYLPNGEYAVAAMPTRERPAAEFSAAEVEAAVRGAQSGTLPYPAFCERAAEAGCVGYIVSMVGQRVVYYGRAGDTHVEWFPGAKRGAGL